MEISFIKLLQKEILREMDSSRKDKEYIANVISSVKLSFSGSDSNQDLLRKLELKWKEKLKIIDEEAEKAAGNLLKWPP